MNNMSCVSLQPWFRPQDACKYNTYEEAVYRALLDRCAGADRDGDGGQRMWLRSICPCTQMCF